MGLLDAFSQDSHQQVTDGHKGNITFDLLAAAAAYEGAKVYEKHCEANGKPDNHAKAKEIAAAGAAAFITHMVSTKGLDFIDQQKAKHAASKQVEEVIVVEN
ncbi:hypothetical protein F5887DRAFT_956904 [Amanita rubescens]|nr:hypothetical protein F5887DRAFT_1018417 [Amanita rubescens]KAF8347152.1 hypothetical protein F5887DRAFT_956904 [Amanita rubescens]